MDVQKLIEEVKAMTVLELNELVKALEAELADRYPNAEGQSGRPL